jgi:hypothetical protein
VVALEDVVPPQIVDALRADAPARHPVTGQVFAHSPLPPAAAYFYATSGCFLLAVKLAEISGLPLALDCDRDGRPKHAFVVDGLDYIDAFGRQPLAALRARGARIVYSVTTQAMVEAVAADREGRYAELFNSRSMAEAAGRAARVLLGDDQ